MQQLIKDNGGPYAPKPGIHPDLLYDPQHMKSIRQVLETRFATHKIRLAKATDGNRVCDLAKQNMKNAKNSVCD